MNLYSIDEISNIYVLMNTGPIVCNYSKVIVDAEHLVCTKPGENKYTDSQRIGYFSYFNKDKTKKGQLQFKTDRITMAAYSGIPKYHEKYYPDDAKRAKSFKVALQDGPLKDKINEMDDYFSSDDFKISVLGWTKKKAAKMVYQPLLRKGRVVEEIDEEEDDSATIAKKKKKLESVLKYGEEPDYIKPVIDLEYGTNNVKTSLMINQGTPEAPKLVKVDVETLDELNEYIGYLSENVYLLTFSKLWEKVNPETKLKPSDPDQWIYGPILKVVAIDCIPGSGTNTVVKVVKSNPLLSDDEEEEDTPPAPAKKAGKKVVAPADEDDEPVPKKKATKKVVPEPEDDDEEEEVVPVKGKKTAKKVAPPEDDDEEEEEVVVPVKGKKVAKKVVPEPEDDEEEEEVVVPVKGKKVAKKVAPPEPEDDDDEEEEVVVPVKEKKTAKKIAPPEDDDDEEDVIPVKAKKTAKKIAPPEPEPEDDDEEEEVIPVKAKKTAKKIAPPEDDDDEEEVVVPVKAKKTTKKVVKPPVDDDDEMDEPVAPKKGKKAGK